MKWFERVEKAIEAARGDSVEWTNDQVLKFLKEELREDDEVLEHLVDSTARNDLRRYEKAHQPHRHKTAGQQVLFYAPDALLVFGDGTRVYMKDGLPRHGRKRVAVVTRNLRAQVDAANSELEYWEARLDADWREDQTLDDLEREAFGYVDPPEGERESGWDEDDPRWDASD